MQRSCAELSRHSLCPVSCTPDGEWRRGLFFLGRQDKITQNPAQSCAIAWDFVQWCHQDRAPWMKGIRGSSRFGNPHYRCLLKFPNMSLFMLHQLWYLLLLLYAHMQHKMASRIHHLDLHQLEADTLVFGLLTTERKPDWIHTSPGNEHYQRGLQHALVLVIYWFFKICISFSHI